MLEAASPTSSHHHCEGRPPACQRSRKPAACYAGAGPLPHLLALLMRSSRPAPFGALSFRHCERSEAIQSGEAVASASETGSAAQSGLLRRFAPRIDVQSSGAGASRERIYFSSPAKAGRGTARSVVEGARGGAVCIRVTDLCSGANAPTGALRAPPPPLSRGRIKSGGCVARTHLFFFPPPLSRWRISTAERTKRIAAATPCGFKALSA
jgi:hypothetical protein